MPQIDVKSSQPGGIDNRIELSSQQSAEMELRLRRLFNDRVLRDEEKLRKENLAAERKLNEQTLREEKRLRAEAQREQKRQAVENARAQKERAREAARQEKVQRDEERRQQRAEEARRQAFRGRVEQGAVIGGVIGAAAHGDIPGAISTLGGAAGGVVGELAGGPVGAILGAVIGELIGKLAFPARAIYNAAKTAADLQIQTYALGRAGGFSGEALFQSFTPGKDLPPAWMTRLGLTAPHAMEMISNFGIVPGSAGNARGMVETLRRLELQPAFSALPEGTVEAVARQGVGLGMAQNTPEGVQRYDTQFARLIQEAMSKGMDQSKIMDALQSTLDTMTRSGALSLSPQDTANLLFRTMMTGTPGGRSGQLAANIAAGQAGVMSDIVRNPLTTALLVGQLPKFGNLRTPGDVERFVGHGNLPAGAVKLITDAANAGYPQVALEYASQLAAGDPGRLAQLTAPGIASVTGGRSFLAPLVTSAVGGISRADALNAALMSPEGLPAGVAGGGGTGQGVPGGTLYDPQISDADYAKRLRAMRVPEALIPQFIAAGKRNGVSPAILAAIAAQESHFNQKALGPQTKYGRAHGMMQIMPENMTPDAAASAGGNIERGAEIFAGDIKAAKGDTFRALQLYNGSPKLSRDNPQTSQYAREVLGRAGAVVGPGGTGAGGGLPTEAFRLQTQAAQQDLFTSNLALQNLGGVATGAAKAIDGLGTAASSATKALTTFYRDLAHGQVDAGPIKVNPTTPGKRETVWDKWDMFGP